MLPVRENHALLSEPTSGRISSFDPSLWPVDDKFRAMRSLPVGGRLSAPLGSVSETQSVEISWEAISDEPTRFFNLSRGEEKRYTIVPDGHVAKQLDLDVHYVQGPSSRLLVVLHGALDRKKFTLPRFEYRRALKDFKGSILFVQDPTLYTHERLSLGWYVGNHLDNGHAMVEYLVRAIAQALGAPKILMAGSSGGGYAAMAISARIPGSEALAFSPQTSIEKYQRGHRQRLISAAFPGMRPTRENLIALQDRFDLGAIYSKGTSNHVSYLQNTGDPVHVRDHMLPFMKHAGLDLFEGEMRNDKIKVECRFLREGHGGPTPQQLNLYVNRVFKVGI